MIYALACRCANSEPRLRTFLRENGYEGWQSIRVIKGKQECINFLAPAASDKEIDKLKGYLQRSSSWSIIIGHDGEKYEWVDLGHMDLKQKLDAELLVKEYK